MIGPTARSPSPKQLTGPWWCARRAAAHWAISARVGTRHSAGVGVAAIAARATWVLPLPVGMTRIPRRPARRHAASAACW